MPAMAVTAIGADRPGIIARVTGVLYEHGGNLTDSSMTILGGHFAIMLLVDAEQDPAELERALAEATADLGLFVRVSEVGEGRLGGTPADHVVSVYGTDRPGIVHKAASTLADAGVNVTDLTTQVLGGEEPVYACVMEVDLSGADPTAIAEAIKQRVGGVEVSIHPLDIETL